MTKTLSLGFSKMTQYALAVVGVVATALAATPTYAAIEYTSQSATTTALFQEVGGDLVQTAVTIIGITMGIAVFIFVVFWGWRRLRRAMNG